MDWRLSGFDVSRRTRLEARDIEIARLLSVAFGRATRDGNIKFFDEKREDSDDVRVVVQFLIDFETLDQFMNGRAGYRAAFREGINVGESMNRRIISVLTDTFEPIWRQAGTVSVVGTGYQRLCFRERQMADLFLSLSPDLSKIWICMLNYCEDGINRQLTMGINFSKRIGVGKNQYWSVIEGDEAGSWLEMKGAFLGPAGAYQVKPMFVRSARLRSRGEA